MAFEQTWRWFGPRDPISLEEIRQTGVTGIVTALHQIPVGQIWPIEEIEKRKTVINAAGMQWSVVESLPVHEEIKKQSGSYKLYIENYAQSIRNLASCGIDTICYNFMPILDWSRTNLGVKYYDGAITTKFQASLFAAFDIYILKRSGSELDYSSRILSEAKSIYEKLSTNEIEDLLKTILLGLPGSLEAYTLEEFKTALEQYRDIDSLTLRDNLKYFLTKVIPAAQECSVYLVIHPDDPPWPLLGLPRVVGNAADLRFILNSIDSVSNGLTFCTGSLGAGYFNDLVDMSAEFASRINFLHLRNLKRDSDGNFMEAYHLEGDIDLYSIIKNMLLEQKRRVAVGRKDFRLPFRPDHGHLMTAEPNREGIYPGYSLLGRMRGISELRGLELGIRLSLGL